METAIVANNDAMTVEAFWTLLKSQNRKVREDIDKLIRKSFIEEDTRCKEISARTRLERLRGSVTGIPQEDIDNDERLKYILGE